MNYELPINKSLLSYPVDSYIKTTVLGVVVT